MAPTLATLLAHWLILNPGSPPGTCSGSSEETSAGKLKMLEVTRGSPGPEILCEGTKRSAHLQQVLMVAAPAWVSLAGVLWLAL